MPELRNDRASSARTGPLAGRGRVLPGVWPLILLAVGFSSPAFAREVKVSDPIFNAAAVREFPRAIFSRITEKITHQTTFEQLSPNGLIRWWTRTNQAGAMS